MLGFPALRAVKTDGASRAVRRIVSVSRFMGSDSPEYIAFIVDRKFNYPAVAESVQGIDIAFG